MSNAWILGAFLFFATCSTYKYDPVYAQWNLNQNQTAVDPLDYWGEWSGHTYTPSPSNWRFPFYTLFLDRFVNGDPSNDNINGTAYEHDPNSNQMRHGGDLQGLVDTLDYLQGMGIKGVYIAGSPFINSPWGYDQYSPLDLSILDQHFGDIEMWRTAIQEIHIRHMYVIIDNTFATMGDLVGFDGYLNTTTPFTLAEHEVQWKSDRHYHDFNIGNNYNKTCNYPKFWLETGYPVDEDVTKNLKGCYDSDFDQYGDTEAFGVFPDWRRQLSKFASVQDRLREWHEPVRNKLENFYCMLIASLDIDGYRYDKATQSTIDAMGFMNEAMRTCARRYGKENFFTPGEITGGNVFGSLYLGRGRQPDMLPENLTAAATMTNNSAEQYFLRAPEHGALDAAAFHYTVYRTLTRFLGMDGNLEAGYDAPPNWVDMWNDFLLTNDFVNPNTGVFDPRHMYGVTNQDVFRWPAITNGVHRQLLGHFITTIELPGAPLLLWGEEQAFYVLDNTASNYIFGRQAMSSATAWQMHGCYHLDSTQFFKMPLNASRHGCQDVTVSYDHRDPSHPVRSIIHHMNQLREQFPVLQDGFFLQQLSNQTEQIQYPGSGKVTTETGMWSVMRSGFPGVQDLSGTGAGDLPIWLLYSNANATTTYTFDCSDNDTALNTTSLIAPYDAGTTVKNLFYPYDEHTLNDSVHKLGINGSTNPNGCLSTLDMAAYDFRAYVPVGSWVGPKPMVTKFSPGHDARLKSIVGDNDTQSVDIEFQFSAEMDCESVTNSIMFNSTTESNMTPTLERDSIICGVMDDSETPPYVGAISSTWTWSATLNNVANGIHAVSIRNASSEAGERTNAVDRFLFRIGRTNNPLVFTTTANYSSSLLSKSEDGSLMLYHSAAGADKWRYSTNWGSTFSTWMPYDGGNTKIEEQPWSGTDLQSWKGTHVRVEYFSRLAGSSDHIQQGDLDYHTPRRFPHLFLNGPYNQYGYDAGLENQMKLSNNNTWEHHFMTEWSLSGALAQINVWGINPDGKPDQTVVMGDADGDSILDRLPPSSLSSIVLNITQPPPKPHLGWRVVINDGTLRFELVPSGNMWSQIIVFVLLCVVPIITAAFGVWSFMQSFYQVKFNEIGISEKAGLIPAAIKKQFKKLKDEDNSPGFLAKFNRKPKFLQQSDTVIDQQRRRTVLIATMEYDIEDWAIKIKIGGLGVMSQLMGKNLGYQDLIWIVPCVGGVDYPEDERAAPMTVTVLGTPYEVQVQYHVLRNITYVLLDAPVFRQQTKSEPYPPRMDDLSSAIYYSAWNQCIAQALNRFPVDLYHINDYHGSVAPLYLLPRTIPACLSLHNAEFQGLWPMRTKHERDEVCSVFNLSTELVQRYVQFGEVFNLLHAGASYLRLHQQGFGAVGVSKKYGKRSYARYPIFWGLKKVGKLPNPDPSDTGEWDKKLPKESDIRIDPEFEAGRPELKRQAQEWAGLDQNPNAELFVFVGRWSMQKGVDLIADVFPSILESNPNVQVVTIGPVIDLYGKFAALKLDRMMKLYPGRVFSKPVFTALPPFIFSGAEFALIPSRDEPFGLVAVEFGRKGALGVGARVGGLGQMPGWWYTVESTTTSHLIRQFKQAIDEALSSKTEVRALMRARSAKQRFPVAQWCEDLEILQSTAIRIHDKVEATKRHSVAGEMIWPHSSLPSPGASGAITPAYSRAPSYAGLSSLTSRLWSHAHSREPTHDNSARSGSGLSRTASLGSHRGPGHVGARDGEEPHVPAILPSVPDVEGDDTGLGTAVTQNYNEAAGHEDDSDDNDSDNDEGVTMPTQTRGRYERVPCNDEVPFSSPPRSPGLEMTNMPNQITSPDDSPPLPSPQRPDSGLLMPPPLMRAESHNRISASPSMLSVNSIVGEKTDFKLQKVDPFFTDSSGEFARAFEKKLDGLDGRNSETSACIEEFLVKSEKQWFVTFRNVKLGRHNVHSRQPSVYAPQESRPTSSYESNSDHGSGERDSNSMNDEFLLGRDYKPPTGLRNWMQLRIGDWPVYAFFMGFGQIIAANSYQITLLTGEVGQTADKLYSIASVYLVTSICWWILFRRFSSMLCLSLPFFFYGLAFILIGTAHYASTASGRGWVQNVGTGMYAAASSSGSIFFALNFGDEGGAQVKAWVFRACVIQGTQQIYVVALWYWGSHLNKRTADGITSSDPVSSTWKITAITLPIAMLLWAIGLLMWFGLPNYYRQAPGQMPSFYKSLLRRKIVLWFFVTVIIQNFFLSAPYGRNWSFLWSSSHTKTWQVVLLVILFFVVIWALFLWLFAVLSKSHSWILPLFAIGLGAPRWAQIWWGTSNIGLYLPWAGGYTASALVSRALWLWLGTLDAIQGVGFGMILLATLTRVHVASTLISAQVLGSLATIAARACAPNRIGPGPISPDISGTVANIWQPWFWVGLVLNLSICFGYFKFYRKEQLSKP
ncbi:Cell wall alpha-1,3-glucan synthase ags1 [Exophiala xenobiotica]|nr:Cell wall alpha-1,3-glucan synthase ags1 [Exophiala xenobiotica]KAK5226065.1 Cell wall alpha-1,3-glucan synthase ags1 [Exophiala xenobiotica]KAK5272761.1 Cell wall alpha-1,3-glucan synthase ags1 [Exophiala xenobiotica]KAK5298886.1 Cell wall alpha-1,3-glucan synthase ags1 [Exophiala xenobiotica]KAK5341557.1 Cell wall alpha-1,3-glucan synthase ags1 [Exophiala xenobiotica]